MDPATGRPGAAPDPRSDDLRASLRAARDLPQRRARRRPVEVAGVDDSLLPLIDKAIAHLADRLAVTREELVVEAAGPVTWSDGSCGCPEPGRAYPQVPVDGVYIRLSAAGHPFHYHGGGRRDLFLCEP